MILIATALVISSASNVPVLRLSRVAQELVQAERTIAMIVIVLLTMSYASREMMMCQLLSSLLACVGAIATVTPTVREAWNVTTTQAQFPGAPELQSPTKNTAMIPVLLHQIQRQHLRQIQHQHLHQIQHQHQVVFARVGVSLMRILGLPNVLGSIALAAAHAPLPPALHQQPFAKVGAPAIRALGLPNALGSIALAAANAPLPPALHRHPFAKLGVLVIRNLGPPNAFGPIALAAPNVAFVGLKRQITASCVMVRRSSLHILAQVSLPWTHTTPC